MDYYYIDSLHGSGMSVLDVISETGFWRITYSTGENDQYSLSIDRYPERPNLMGAGESVPIEPEKGEQTIKDVLDKYLSGKPAMQAGKVITYHADANSVVCLTHQSGRWYTIYMAINIAHGIRIASGCPPYPREKPDVPPECTPEEFSRRKWEILTKAVDSLLDLI